MSGDGTLDGRMGLKANALLPQIARLFKTHDVPYCLDGGTLLGIVREGRLLPWDNDLDFFVPREAAPKIDRLRWHLLRLGCKLDRITTTQAYGPIGVGVPRIYKIKSLRNIWRERVVIDLIFKYADEADFHWLIGNKRPVHKKVARRFYDQFDTIHYRGVDYPIPCDVEMYLTHRYGDWRKTQKDYDFRTDDHSII